ncbi:MAG: right-handed parallel beta-helix repeat-containing protein [Acidobacteriaceae bacterium]|nr:right-handed parallel beta-helix repeat-containing protein [Acidobacteriaceae bacterium]
MKRRDFWKSIGLGSAALAPFPSSSHALARPSQDHEKSRRRGRAAFRFVCFASLIFALFMCPGRIQAIDISGNISSTLTIFDNSELVGDVNCTAALLKAPCIVFGADHIELSLNGHTITGPVNPPTNCSLPTDSTFGVGIEVNAKEHVEIEGPGVIQKFQRWGILLLSSTQVTLKRVTVNRNCWSGVQTEALSESTFKDDAFVNNAAGSNGAPCGGICVSDSKGNTIRKCSFHGNGSVDNPDGNVDFGIGFEGSSTENLVEESDFGGNVNGVLVFPEADDNVVHDNIITGNPPAQVQKTFASVPAASGADIHDLHTSPSTNTFDDNFCLTYIGPGIPPCPNIPKRERDRDESRERGTERHE